MKRCPHCPTHPELLDSGYATEAKVCPVCRRRFRAEWEAMPPARETPEERQRRIDQWWKHLRQP